MAVLTPTDAATAYLADFERFERTRPAGEPAALRLLRRQAIERFAELGFPTTRQEQWRATDVSPIARTPFERAAGPARPEALPASLDGLDHASYAATLVFVDGRFSPSLSVYRELPAGAVVTSLAAALAEHPELVEPWLARHASFAAQPFVALNTAFFEDGAFLYLPRGVAVMRPIQFLYLASGGTTDGAATVVYPRNLVVAGESSAATLVEAYRGPEEAVYFTCAVTELVAGPNSSLDHYKLQREGRSAFHMATFEVHAGRSAAVSSHSISLGGALVRNDVNALLAGEGIDANLNGLYMVGGRQLVDNHMRVEHAAPHCGSHELYKGVLEGRSRAVFNGLIHVRPGAQKTDAKQSNRNLLLSREAVANSNPQLEIFADDVKCTHGSTVGQLDEDAVFYLRSRGIGAEAARSLLTYAFASDIVERVKVEPLRHELEEHLFASLPKGEVVRQAV
jgi:Fe-S cluster assembly protein SufD